MSHPLHRTHCPGCGRDVPILSPREGTRNRPPDLSWRYRFHHINVTGGRRCGQSGQPVALRHLPDELSPLSTGP